MCVCTSQSNYVLHSPNPWQTLAPCVNIIIPTCNCAIHAFQTLDEPNSKCGWWIVATTSRIHPTLNQTSKPLHWEFLVHPDEYIHTHLSCAHTKKCDVTTQVCTSQLPSDFDHMLVIPHTWATCCTHTPLTAQITELGRYRYILLSISQSTWAMMVVFGAMGLKFIGEYTHGAKPPPPKWFHGPNPAFHLNQVENGWIHTLLGILMKILGITLVQIQCEGIHNS